MITPLMLPSTISDLSLLVAALLFLPILVLIIKRSSTSNDHRLLPPSPPRLPLIGNLHQLGSLPHQSLRDLSNRYGPLMLLNLGLAPTLVVSSAEAAKEIMKTHDHIFASRPSLEVAKLIFRGEFDLVFAPYGEYWRQLRKICVNRLLSAKMVQSFGRVREEEVASLVSKISSQSTTGDVVNLSEAIMFFTNAVVCKSISSKYFTEEGRTRAICELVDANSALLGQPSVADFIPALGWVDEISGLRRKARRVGSRWGRVLDEIIKGHADESSKEPEDNCNGRDFVDVLLALEGESSEDNTEFPFNREISKALLQDMITGGTETSFNVLDWGMAELMRNQYSMDKLQSEVRKIAGNEFLVKEEDLSKMSYLKAMVKEILRLHPPGSLLVPHESMRDCEVQGYYVPKRTRVIVNAWAIGRDPKYWEAPDKFLPERFLNNPIDFKGNDFQFIPFGAGRRICPALQFAVSTIELALANIMHKFDWELPNGVKNEEMDMSDFPGITTRRRQSLYLVAKSFTN